MERRSFFFFFFQKKQNLRRCDYRTVVVPVLLRPRQTLQFAGSNRILERRQSSLRDGLGW